MPSITFDDFSDGEVLTATKLNTQFEKVETLINTDLLDNSNLENPDFFISYPFYIASVSSSTLRPKIRFPGSATYAYVDLSFVAHTVSAGSTFQVDLLDNSGSSVLSSVPTPKAFLLLCQPLVEKSIQYKSAGQPALAVLVT